MAKKEDKEAPAKNEDQEPLTPEAVDEGTAKSKKIKKIILITVPIVIAIIGAVLFYMFVIKGPKNIEEPTIEGEGEKAAEVSIAENTNIYLDMEQIVVGLSSTGKKAFLRIDLTLRLNSELERSAVMAKMPIIKDALITFLRSLRTSDFNSSNSTLYLKEEISKRLNKITAPIVVKEVLFQEITVN
ncbi:MAG: flagellar basal body-associated FliL family protein [Rickettsiaceae bacterium]|nr:flagellar basal body-associated FliL family protein [Rickettsiaceae bacterium]